MDVTEFGARLREAREYAGLTRKDVVQRLGLGSSTVHDAETLAYGSKHTTSFAALYGVSAHWLATGEGEMLPAESAPAAFALRRLAAVYRALNPELRTVLLDTARSLYKHNKRLSLSAAPATPRHPRATETPGA